MGGHLNVLLFCLLSVLTIAPGIYGSYSKPAFCRNYDCPKYSVIKKEKDYEFRQYETSHWVTTSYRSISSGWASMRMFRRLFNYIQGQNVRNQKINMTVPVLLRYENNTGNSLVGNYTMFFYLPMDNAPRPTGPNVRLVTQPAMKAYVRSFPGYPLFAFMWRMQANKLAQSIGDSKRYDTDFWYASGYNAPFETTNRHNEIWFVAN